MLTKTIYNYNFLVFKVLLFYILLSLFSVTIKAQESPNKNTIAILDIESNDMSDAIKHMANQCIKSTISKISDYTIVSRNEKDKEKIFTEMKFQREDDLIDRKTTAKIGKALGAKKLIISKAIKLNDTYSINLNILDIELSSYIKNITKICPLDGNALTECVELAACELVSNDCSKRSINNIVLRSLILPGWGQIYKKENTKGYTIMTIQGLSIVSALVSRLEVREQDFNDENKKVTF